MKTPILFVALMFAVTSTTAVELELPIAMSDVGIAVYGVAPYGYHVAEHRFDGHPGLDFEYKPGARILAAHGGVFRFTADSRDANLKAVTIEWQEGGVNYQTFYTNVSTIEPGITNGSTVATGQAFGTAGSVSATVGNHAVTYAMTHFQFADNRVAYGLSNFSAISPEPYFSAAARADLNTLWQRMQYHQMICEPYLTTSRGVIPYPVVKRRWTRQSGSLANTIEFTCDFASTTTTAYSYRLLDAAGAAGEAGTAIVSAVVGGISSIDLTTSTGGLRRGVLTVKDGTMRIDYAASGASRPADLAGASVYATTGATICASLNDALCFGGDASPYHAGDRVSLSVAIDWGKVGGGATAGDLYVALKPPGGELLFAQQDGRWSGDVKPFVAGSNASGEIRLLDAALLPAGLATGSYVVYAALNQSEKAPATDALLGNIASTSLYIAP